MIEPLMREGERQGLVGNVFAWEGACHVHHQMTAEDITKIRRDDPGAVVIVHGEVRPELQRLADEVLSTSQMAKYVDAPPRQAALRDPHRVRPRRAHGARPPRQAVLQAVPPLPVHEGHRPRERLHDAARRAARAAHHRARGRARRRGARHVAHDRARGVSARPSAPADQRVAAVIASPRACSRRSGNRRHDLRLRGCSQGRSAPSSGQAMERARNARRRVPRARAVGAARAVSVVHLAARAARVGVRRRGAALGGRAGATCRPCRPSPPVPRRAARPGRPPVRRRCRPCPPRRSCPRCRSCLRPVRPPVPAPVPAVPLVPAAPSAARVHRCPRCRAPAAPAVPRPRRARRAGRRARRRPRARRARAAIAGRARRAAGVTACPRAARRHVAARDRRRRWPLEPPLPPAPPSAARR